MRVAISLLTLSCFATVFFAGCSGGGPTTHAVSGKVTYQGNPVADAQIGFVPTDATGAVKPARGQTDADGNYRLSTYLGPGDDAHGAMAGSYKVTVAKGFPQDKIATYEDMAKFKSEIPERYADTANTPLVAEVTSGGANTFDFVLEEK